MEIALSCDLKQPVKFAKRIAMVIDAQVDAMMAWADLDKARAPERRLWSGV